VALPLSNHTFVEPSAHVMAVSVNGYWRCGAPTDDVCMVLVRREETKFPDIEVSARRNVIDSKQQAVETGKLLSRCTTEVPSGTHPDGKRAMRRSVVPDVTLGCHSG
jgi:hypothetical protein